jgi:hypothetical protein
MLFDARTSGVPQSRKLKSGLTIKITVYTTNVTILLARDNTYPSLKEWKTMLEHFPYKVENGEPDEYINRDGKYTLRGSVQTRQY